jgi:hypothetical protein
MIISYPRLCIKQAIGDMTARKIKKAGHLGNPKTHHATSIHRIISVSKLPHSNNVLVDNCWLFVACLAKVTK